MLERYLEIQRLRFGDRLGFAIDVAADAGRAIVPVLLLQPLVENAIRHGIAPSEAPGRVTVRGFRRGDDLVVEVWNTGRLAVDAPQGIGLAATAARLSRLHGERARLQLVAEQGGVLARVTLPWSVAP
jgi:LytS/YehU family sensor histidine kinase